MTTEQLSLAYVEALTQYCVMKKHCDASMATHGTVLREDKSALLRATDAMYTAQNTLWQAIEDSVQ
jgi:hypothetical protein